MEEKNEILKIIDGHNINGFNVNGGTDKAWGHSYDIFYSEHFEKYRKNSGTILEIGVQYGGSSLLWHDFLPNYKIVMVDIHNQVHSSIWEKMNSDRYEYINMDAFNLKSIELLSEKYQEGFDIIVEDGPHTLETQIFTLKEYSKLLKPGGILVIEDIQKIEYVENLLSTNIDCDYNSLELIDLRQIKNRYDDLLIVLKK